MPQSHLSYSDRMAPVRCQILQMYGRRTIAVRLLRAPFGRRSFFAHRTMPREVLTRRYNFSRHRTMFQPQTASHGRRTGNRSGTVRFLDGILSPSNRTVTVRSPYVLR